LARDSEYQFVETDVSELESAMTAEYEQLTGKSVLPAGPEKLLIKWAAYIILHERILNNYTGNQNVPSRAEGKNLDALGELLYNVERPQAQAAVCTERFHLTAPQESAILIPKGTRVSDVSGTLVWETTVNAYVPAGAEYVDVSLRCSVAGTVGNGYAKGQLSKLIDTFEFADKCENTEMTDGGADRADDNKYYQLIRDGMDAFSTAGSMSGYVYHAEKASTEIGDVVANSPTPGCVDIYVLMNDGSFASDVIKSAVLEACSSDKVRPLTDFVSVRNPEAVEYDVELTYYLPLNSRQTPAAIAAAVQEAVYGYLEWQGTRFGRDIDPSELVYRVKQTGVKRVEVTSPTFTKLRRSEDKLAPQVAVIRDVSVTNGGIEDE